MPGKDYFGIAVLMAMVIAIPFGLENDYYIGILVFAALNCLTCVGLCLLMGYAGQISIGHGAFVAVGAYTSAILTAKYGWSPWPSMGAGAVLAVIIAVAVGVPSLRLKGHYLAMATLGFASIVHIISVAATGLTGGPSGITNVPRFGIFGYALDTDLKYYYFAWTAVGLGLFIAFNLIHSRIGRGLRSIHGSEDAAAAAGVNTTVYKIQIFVISAVFAAISGSLYAYYVNYIDPGPFGVAHSVLLVTMVAVGGLHNIWGAIIGAVLLTLLPEMLSFISDYLGAIGIQYQPDYDFLIYGAILLFIMLFLPEGLFSGFADAARYVRGLVFRCIRPVTEKKSVARE